MCQVVQSGPCTRCKHHVLDDSVSSVSACVHVPEVSNQPALINMDKIVIIHSRANTNVLENIIIAHAGPVYILHDAIADRMLGDMTIIQGRTGGTSPPCPVHFEMIVGAPGRLPIKNIPPTIEWEGGDVKARAIR